MRWTRNIAIILGVLGCVAVSPSALAAHPGAYVRPEGHVAARVHVQIAQQQQHRAREAYKKGEIQSLSVIRHRVIKTYNGNIISTQFVEVPQGNVRYVYKFRVLAPDGTVMVVHVNAQNANIIHVKGTR